MTPTPSTPIRYLIPKVTATSAAFGKLPSRTPARLSTCRIFMRVRVPQWTTLPDRPLPRCFIFDEQGVHKQQDGCKACFNTLHITTTDLGADDCLLALQRHECTEAACNFRQARLAIQTSAKSRCTARTTEDSIKQLIRWVQSCSFDTARSAANALNAHAAVTCSVSLQLFSDKKSGGGYT